MPELTDGQQFEMKGSGAKPYLLRNTGGIYDCSCVAWKMQSLPVDVRTCKHLVAHLGIEAELARVGYEALPTAVKKKLDKKDLVTVGSARAQPTKQPKEKAPSEEKSPPAILLAHSWDNTQDVTGWWISEKLDGVRAFWDGARFVSRLGNVYYAPDYFTVGFPNHPLDGELWIGRNQFQETVSVVRRKNGDEHWKRVKYVVFDAPHVAGPFEERHASLAVVAKNAKFIEHIGQIPCRGVEHLREALALIEKYGGEGLMLRQPGSAYEIGRSNSLLKVKSFIDAEATVIGHTKGKGRHKGRCGALEVRLANGTEFKVGTGLSDEQREAPPKVGSVVSFRYQELTNDGVPRFPSFIGVRHDVEV